jgi:phenylpropionate dioxygenase-like ring-hydroxylating dioxygenase large terminal subunit
MRPLAVEDLLPAQPLEGHVLPPRSFVSAALYEVEMARIFEKSWVHVADLPDLQKAGDYVTANIGPTPVIVVRGDDGELRAFLNACRHRGATLAEDSGNCGRQLRCPYHAWSYSTTGELVGVPYREEFGCRTAGLDLVPVRVGAVGPLVFACLDADAPPLAEWTGELGASLQRARGAEMQTAFTIEYEVAVNWKVYVENGLEGYHVGFVHDLLADFVQIQKGGAENFYEPHASYTLAQISPQYLEMAPPPPHLPLADRGRVRFGHVFPNIVPVLTPLDFAYLRIDPIAPDRIRLRGRSFDLGGDAAMTRDFRREAFDRTNKQDIAVVERVQRGLRARGLPGGVHSDVLEARIAHFERQVVEALQR